MDATAEKWEWIPGFEGHYQASTCGRIRSRKTGHCRLMSLKYNKQCGYYYVILHKDNVAYTRSVHRLVAKTFLPNPDDLPQVNHINEIKTDNNVENLEWCTAHENNLHSKHRREKPIVIKSPDGEVLGTLKSRWAASQILGVGKSAITNAIRRKTMCGGFLIEELEVM